MPAPFEPLESAPEQILTLKVTLLLALTSLKSVGDLQAPSVSKMCMEFAPGLVKVTQWPRPVPKVLSTSFRSQVVTLHSFHSPPFASGEDERLHMLGLVFLDNRHAQGAFPKRVSFTQRRIPYTENKGYANNPRHFHVSTFF